MGVVYAAAGGDIEDPGLLLGLTFVQQVITCGAAIFLASRIRRPRAWHFGLRRARFWPSLGWAVLGYVSFFLAAFVYTLVIGPEGDQTVAEDLGADESTLALIVAGVLIVVVAPIAEEFFFRGFFYRALRSKYGILAAAGIDGVVFGLIHFAGSETLELLPILGFLGFVFCLIYERTGTLYTVIALHALNNTIAYWGASGNAAVPLALGSLMLLACTAGPWLLHPRRTAVA